MYSVIACLAIFGRWCHMDRADKIRQNSYESPLLFNPNQAVKGNKLSYLWIWKLWTLLQNFEVRIEKVDGKLFTKNIQVAFELSINLWVTKTLQWSTVFGLFEPLPPLLETIPTINVDLEFVRGK